MSFKNMFRENYDLMKEALETNDVAVASKMIGKKISSGHLLFQYYLDFSKLSYEMTQLLVRDISDAHWQKWGFKEGARDTVCSVMFSMALSKGRADLMEIFTGTDIKLNAGKAASHAFTDLCGADMPEEVKQAVLVHILQQGVDKVAGHDDFLRTAAAAGFIVGFDAVKPLLKVDIHSDNEHMLRHAANAGQTDMCLHLARKHGADIDVALITESTLGHQKAAETLQAARDIFKPEARAVPTIAGLAAQVRTLEQSVAELQANMRDITARLDTLVPEKKLDKRLTLQPLSR